MSLFRRKRLSTNAPRAGTLGAVMAEGWSGLPWGAPLAAFKARFPQAHLTESDWWQTGQEPEPFCGVAMSITQYAFNARDQLCTVAFIPEPEDRSRLSVAAMNELGPPDGMALHWTFGDVVAEVKLAGVMASLTHSTYTDHHTA
jgi:hypothetical protein